jgi:hypothetical protein
MEDGIPYQCIAFAKGSNRQQVHLIMNYFTVLCTYRTYN